MAAARACASCARAEEYAEAVSAAKREARRRSATTPCSSRSTSSTDATSRCRSSPTTTATSSTSTSVTARPSAGTRRCSRRRRRRRSATPYAAWSPRARSRWPARWATPTPAPWSSCSTPTTDEAYFLEMNTRLQVEHPVTEAITGIDLVHAQLDVAAGEPLPFRQDDITVTGHAIEARVYAEDSFGGFLPQAGTADLVRWPTAGGIRVDQALESGQVVSTAYDPMLGKVIAHGPDREAARRALVEALDATGILGLTTNTGFLRALVASDEFRLATIDTAWLDTAEVEPPRARRTPRLRGVDPGAAGRGAGHRAPVPVRRVAAGRYADPDGGRARRDRARRPRHRPRRGPPGRAGQRREPRRRAHDRRPPRGRGRQRAGAHGRGRLPRPAVRLREARRLRRPRPGRRRRLGARADARHGARRPRRRWVRPSTRATCSAWSRR